MSKSSKKITVINTPKPLDNLDNNDNNIQASKEQLITQETPSPEKKKRIVPPRTEAQKAVLAEGRKKGRDMLNLKNAQANAEKEAMRKRLDDQEKELVQHREREFEEKLIKKAVAVKKKQIKRNAVLDQVSDDETPMEKVRELQKKAPKKEIVQPQQPAVNPQPKYYVV